MPKGSTFEIRQRALSQNGDEFACLSFQYAEWSSVRGGFIEWNQIKPGHVFGDAED